MRISKKLYKYITTSLIGIVVVACVGLGYLTAIILTQTAVNSDYLVFAVITVFIAALSLVTMGLVGLSTKVEPKYSVEEIYSLLRRFKDGDGLTSHSTNEADETAVAFEEMLSDLHRSLQSVLIKVRAIDHRGGELTKEIQQVAAEQANLFSLSAAIRLARPQQDGISVIFGELLSLVELSGCLTGDMHEKATQLKVWVKEVGTELEYLLKHVDPSRISAPTGTCEGDIQGEKAASTVE